MDIPPLVAAALFGAACVGTWRYFRLTARLTTQEVTISALTRDLHNGRAVEQQLRDNLAALADTSFDALMIVDSQKRVIIVNRTARELFKVPASALGDSFIALTHNHELEAAVDSALRDEDLPEQQIAIEDHTYRVRATKHLVSDQTLVFVALQDVTELLRLMRARRDMVANFSHDLRTPISNIRLLVDTLLASLGKNTERDQKMLGKIATATDSLQHMTQELIDLSTIESGKAIMRMVSVPLGDIMRSALEMMESQIDEKGLKLNTEGDLSPVVLADPDQVRRVLNNILHNAVKFTPKGGEIRIHASVKSDMVTLCVQDTGPGIPPHERARVFERFYQVDSTRTGGPSPKRRGTGLGLAIAKHIVEAHGGRIWAEGAIPTGACIYFTLPLAGPEKS